MGIFIAGLEFAGPYRSADELTAAAGLCALVSERKGELEIVEVIDLNDVRTVWDDDEYTGNIRFWTETCYGTLMVAVYYTEGMSTVERVALRRVLAVEVEAQQRARRQRTA